MTTVAEESIVGVNVVKAFAQEPRENAKFAHQTERVFGKSLEATRQRAFYVPFLSFLPLLAQAAVLLAGGHRVVNGQLRIGEFVAFNVYVLLLVMPLRMLGMWIGTSQRAVASGERIFEVLDEPEEIVDKPDARAAARRPRAPPLRSRHLRLRPRPPSAPRRRPRDRGRANGGADRPHRLRQDDADVARAAVLRRPGGQPFSSTAPTCATCGSPTFAARSGSSPRIPSSSRRR